MRTNISKTKNKQLPDQVAAVNQLNDLVFLYFDAYSLKSINDTFRQLISSITGPDRRSGKHSPIEICGFVDQVTKTISFVRKCQIYLNSIVYGSSSKNLASMFDVFEIDLDAIEDILLDGLNSWIYQGEFFQEPEIAYSRKATKQINKLYKWLSSAFGYYDEINPFVKGDVSC